MAMTSKMLIAVILIAAAGLFASGQAWAGTNNFLIEPAAPTNPASAMFTLENIYNVLDTRTTNVTKRVGAFVEPTGGPTNGTMHTLDDIMALVTNRAAVQKTGQTNSYATDDDGALKIGVALPNPRFTVQATNTNCVIDNLTGLMWARNANQFGVTNWGAAVANCNDLDYGGYSDWRLPNWQELRSLIDASKYNPALPSGHPFAGVQSVSYWSSTTYAGYTAGAWGVGLHYGYVASLTKVTAYFVWPVRGGQ